MSDPNANLDLAILDLNSRHFIARKVFDEMSEPTQHALSLPYQRHLMLGEFRKLNDLFLMIAWLTQTKGIWCLIMRVNELLSWKRTCLELISRLRGMCWLKPCHFRFNLSHLKSKSYAHDSSLFQLIESYCLVAIETCYIDWNHSSYWLHLD